MRAFQTPSCFLKTAIDVASMEENMSATQVPLTLIVAATLKNGIGKDGALPWPMLKKEMAYFARVTKKVPTPRNAGSVQSDAVKRANLQGTQQNVVVMGRKTWDSIPARFRPLKDRTSVVISSQARESLGDVPEGVVVARDITSGLCELDDFVRNGKAPPIGRAFVIGGTSIYRAALEMEQAKRILLTRIHEDYDCDTFFPLQLDQAQAASGDEWQRRSLAELRDFVDEEVPEGLITEKAGDASVPFEFQFYERV